MKNNNRNIKRRLFKLSLIGNRISRMKHFRGHGVHSPFVYGLVRRVFMHSAETASCNKVLVDSLISAGVSRRRALQLDGAMHYCGAMTFDIDRTESDAEFVVLTATFTPNDFYKAYENAVTKHQSLVIYQPYANRERLCEVMRIVDLHESTSVDNRAYMLYFNNGLPKQHFKL